MKGTFLCHMLAATIVLGLAAPDKLMTVFNEKSVVGNDSNVSQNGSICETPACVHSASFILKNMDSNVDPCQNFYQFACGKFVEETVIPDDRKKVDVFGMASDKIEQQLRLRISDEIEEDDRSAVKKVKSYYQMCMDTDQIEKTSENDLRKIFENQGGCPILEGTSWDEANFHWEKSVFQSNKMGFGTNRFISAGVNFDPRNKTKFLITIDQAETELPGEYYKHGTNDSLVQTYLKGMINIFELLGADKRQAEECNSILDLEIQLTKISQPRNKRRDRFKLMKNRVTLHQLDTNYSGISWSKYLNEILAPHAHLHQQDEVIVVDKKFLESLPELLARTPKRVLANYLCWRTISESAEYLGKKIVNARVEINKAFTGVQQEKPRWKYCLERVSKRFAPALGELYVRNYFDKDAKTNAAHLIKNIRSSLYNLIVQSNWMDNDTKLAALEKLQFAKAYVGYPDELEGDEKINEYYQNITLHPGRFLTSTMSLNNFWKKLQYSKLNNPGIPWIKHSAVATANAFYFQNTNEFDLPAGILQGHFYNKDRPNYMNYGAIGSVIGHEISHAFDDRGSQYDKNGNLFRWWKNETKEAYVNKTKCIIEQFGNYTVKEVNRKIDGINTQAENIADNVGLKAAYFAYDEWAKKNVKEPRLPGLQYTPQQMFWISYANNWCGKVRPESLRTAIIGDSHAPNNFRLIGSVSNMYQFAEDFQCPSGSPMNPINKCSIW